MTNDNILIIGAGGQVGTELAFTLREQHGADKVVASDIREPKNTELLQSGPFEILDVTDGSACLEVVKKHNIGTVYNLAALLSATAEQKPQLGWDLNMTGLFTILDLAKQGDIHKVFWPSSIAVFGPSTPKVQTPQFCYMDPSTVYGISKQAGEMWCAYYHKRWGVDVRSVRYPGLISYKSLPGGGTTDYAVEIFYEALKQGQYTCFLDADTSLPMMYMPDAIKATIDLTERAETGISVRTSYNISGFSINPAELATAIQQHFPDFKIDYAPDYRQQIAEGWPQSIDDSVAQADWNWKNAYQLEDMVKDMLENLKSRLTVNL